MIKLLLQLIDRLGYSVRNTILTELELVLFASTVLRRGVKYVCKNEHNGAIRNSIVTQIIFSGIDSFLPTMLLVSIAIGVSAAELILALQAYGSEKALAVTSDEALKIGLIDLIAEDRADLLRQLDGMTVETSRGPITLHTAGAVINPVNLLFIEQMLVVLTDPNIVFLLITIGVQAILIEISSPGGWVAGFIGVVCLALATYGIGVLPVNWFGVVFLATAFALFVLDVKAPTHGALTVAGIVSLIIGALVLFNSPGTPQFQQVSVPLVIAVSLITAGTFFTLVTFAIRAQKAPLKMGQETLIGQNGTARSDIAPHGNVQLGGELWSAALAEDEAPIPAHARVEVVRVEGLRLIVRRAGESAVK